MNIDQQYLIWLYTTHNYVDFADPRTVDYKTGLTVRLHPTLTFNRGELVAVDYCAIHGDPTSLVLRVDIQWDRVDGVLVKRIETRKYVIESVDGEIEFGDHVKVSEKFYDSVTAAQADVKRRTNIINDLTAKAEAFGVLSYVQDLWTTLDNELNAYKATNNRLILSEINNYEGAWLETPVPDTPFTLRQLIIYELTL